MSNILFIAFEFPPLNRGGVFRSLAFAKYLPQFGINPIVVTLSPDSYANVFDIYSSDHKLGKSVIDSSVVLYAEAGKPKKKSKVGTFFQVYFSIHGLETKEWEDNFFKVAAEAIKQHDIKAIFATVPPFSILPLALKLAKANNLPLVYDFRDAWSQWKMAPYGTRAHYWVNLFYESKYFKYANAIVATSLETLSDFKKLNPGIAADKFHYIPNGYDGQLDTWSSRINKQEDIVIGYVGSFYFTHEARQQMLTPWWRKKGHRMLQYIPQKQDWLYRSPFFFFQMLKTLIEKYPELSQRVKVRFVGKKPGWLEDMIKEFELQSNIELLGEMSHSDAIAFQKKCDMLLITSAKRIGGKDYSIAGKTFEYIQSQKPILAFVCEGAQKDILAQSGMALICDPDKEDENVEIFKDYIEGTTSLAPDYTFLNTLSREYETRQLADIINKTIDNH